MPRLTTDPLTAGLVLVKQRLEQLVMSHSVTPWRRTPSRVRPYKIPLAFSYWTSCPPLSSTTHSTAAVFVLDTLFTCPEHLPVQSSSAVRSAAQTSEIAPSCLPVCLSPYCSLEEDSSATGAVGQSPFAVDLYTTASTGPYLSTPSSAG